MIEPRNKGIVDYQDNSSSAEEESRRSVASGWQQLGSRSGKGSQHHRGPRAGYVFTGVTQELGRAICLLVKMPDGVTRLTKPRPWQVASASKGTGNGTQTRRSRQGIGKPATSEATRDGQTAVLATYSVCRAASRSGGFKSL